MRLDVTEVGLVAWPAPPQQCITMESKEQAVALADAIRDLSRHLPNDHTKA